MRNLSAAIKLASNENPLGASTKAIRAAQEAVLHPHLYPDSDYDELKQDLATFHALASSQITVGNGSENILELIVKAYLHEDKNAIISEYAFLTIPFLLQSHRIKTKIIASKNWGHDIAAMIDAVDQNTRVLFLVNPNNPTGTYTAAKDFHHLIESLPPHVLIVVDEAYADYIVLPDYPNTLAYVNHHPNLIITRTFSKIHGLAALRLGYAISSSDIADNLNRARLPFNVNSIAVKAACAALEDREHVQKSRAMNQNGMRQMEEGLKKLGFDYLPSLGNFITIDVQDGFKIYQKLLNAGVIIRPLQLYQLPKHIRVSIGTDQQNDRFLRALWDKSRD